MNYFRFIRQNRHFLFFGLIAAWTSSFGQTFFLSFFAQDIQNEFTLSNAQYGSIYAGATFLSGILLMRVGRLVDEVPLKYFISAVVIGLAVSAAAFAMVNHIVVLFLAICGLRFCGQGLMSHVAMTSMARHFEKTRGRAIAFAGLGFPLGEAFLPLVLVFLALFFGWREQWWLVVLFLCAVVLPVLLWLVRAEPAELTKEVSDVTKSAQDGVEHEEAAAPLARIELSEKEKNSGVVRALLKDKRFYRVLPALLILPFVMTALFFYQTHIAAIREWPIEILASGLIVFSIFRVGSSLVSGHLIDYFSAKLLLPLSLLPVLLGFTTIAFWHAPLAWFAIMILGGISNGAAGAISTAIWAELYGVAHLGAIRAVYQSLGVISTAMAPMLVGWMLDMHVELRDVFLGFAIAIIIVSLVAMDTNK